MQQEDNLCADDFHSLVYIGGAAWHDFVDKLARKNLKGVMDKKQFTLMRDAPSPHARLWFLSEALHDLNAPLPDVVDSPAWNYYLDHMATYLCEVIDHLGDVYYSTQHLLDCMTYHELGVGLVDKVSDGAGGLGAPGARAEIKCNIQSVVEDLLWTVDMLG